MTISLKFSPTIIIVGVLLLIYPLVVTPFWAVQIGANALILGMIALTIVFLAGYGGMISLAQVTVAGVAVTRSRTLASIMLVSASYCHGRLGS